MLFYFCRAVVSLPNPWDQANGAQKAGGFDQLSGISFSEIRLMNEPDSNREASFERPLPNSSEAERAILGGVILDNGIFPQVIDLLKPDDFFVASHRRVFVAMCRLFDQWMDINPITIGNELKIDSALESTGGISFITNLTYGLPHSANIEHYAKIVKGKANLRRLIKANAKSTQMALDEDDLPEVIIEQSEKAIFDIATQQTEIGFKSASIIVNENIVKIHALQEQGNQVTGLASGFNDLDAKTLGWQHDDLIILAARPSMGKTAFALMLAQHAGIRVSAKVAIFSLEMSKESLVNRMLCSEANIDSQRVRQGFISLPEWDAIEGARQLIQQSKIFINDTPAITTLGIRAKTMRLIAEQGAMNLIIVDYIQLMGNVAGQKRNVNREQEVAMISKEMKGLAKELHVPVIVLAQLNREAERRSDHRPQLSDLRESGGLEQDADVVTLIYREDYYRAKAEHEYVPTNTAELIIAKQRNGPTGIVQLRFQASSGRFENLYGD